MVKILTHQIYSLEDKRLRVFSLSLLWMGLIDFVSGLITIALGQTLLGGIFVALALGFWLIFLPLILLGYHNLSRITVPYYAITLLFIAACYYGPDVNAQYTIFIGAVYPFIVFSPQELKYAFFALPAPLIFYVALEFSSYKLLDPLFGGNHHIILMNDVSRVSMIIASFFIIVAALFMFSRQSAIYETSLLNANRNLDMLIRTICHDIRNPLAVSILYFEKLIREIPKGFETTVAAIKRANSHVDQIIRGINEMQKLKEGKINVKSEDVVLVNAIDEAIFILKDAMENKQIKPVMEVSDSYIVRADQSVLIQSVLKNIISNAVKFSKTGSHINVSALRTDDGFIKISVRDYGIGIPEELKKKIFDPAAHTSRPGTNNEPGTGYGLPIVKSYLEAMGGRIEVNSRTTDTSPFDHGTEIIVSLRHASNSQNGAMN